MSENSDIQKTGIPFKSYNGIEYIYLPETGLILKKMLLQSNPKRFDRIQDIENRYKELNFNKRDNEITVEDIQSHLMKDGFQELLIEVTTSCNLRCEYCVFSGSYKTQRSHGNRFAKFEDVKPTIDYYFNFIKGYKIYNLNRKPTVAFYGGEPLLNFPVIKSSIEYIHKIYNEDVFFTLTTNGTLLTEEMIDFFNENDVWLVFSLDGNKDAHDRNRKDCQGNGTFDKTFSAIEKYKNKKDGYVFVNSVYDYKTDMKQVIDFFVNHPYIINLSASMVNPYDTDYFARFSAKDYEQHRRQMKELENEFMDLLSKQGDFYNRKNQLNLLIGKPALSVMFRKLLAGNDNQMVMYTGSCIPGVKLFADIDGNFMPCEKVPRDLQIGSNKKGLDYKKIGEIIESYNRVILTKCKKCKFKTLCSYCYQAFWCDGKFRHLDSNCEAMKEYSKEILRKYVTICENRPEWFDTFTKEYYKGIAELEVTLK